MTSSDEIRFRLATSADVSTMAACRSSDPAARPADPRMAAYFEGTPHPQHALPPRVGCVALAHEGVIGYIAGHLTTRDGHAGEGQYVCVCWQIGSVRRVRRRSVCVDADSPAAKPFSESAGAAPFRRLWYGWDEISVLRG